MSGDHPQGANIPARRCAQQQCCQCRTPSPSGDPAMPVQGEKLSVHAHPHIGTTTVTHANAQPHLRLWHSALHHLDGIRVHVLGDQARQQGRGMLGHLRWLDDHRVASGNGSHQGVQHQRHGVVPGCDDEDNTTWIGRDLGGSGHDQQRRRHRRRLHPGRHVSESILGLGHWQPQVNVVHPVDTTCMRVACN